MFILLFVSAYITCHSFVFEIKFCYKEVKSNLRDLSISYNKNYESLALANEIFTSLNDDKLQNIPGIDLKVFITEHIANNNLLSKTIASDFNMN